MVGRSPGYAPGVPVSGGFRVELSKPGRVTELEEQPVNVSALNQGSSQQSHVASGAVERKYGEHTKCRE